MIAGREDVAGVKASHEMPTPKLLSAARMRRATEDALRYVTARLHGEHLPSLAHVPADMAHELRTLKPVDVEVMHRQLLGALDITGPGWWDGPAREVQAPGPDHDTGLRPILT